MNRLATRASAAATAAALVAALGVTTTAVAQTPAPPAIRSVGVAPVGTDANDPNGGQWFTALLDLGQSTTMTARIANPAETPATVRLYLRDMIFNNDGTPVLNDEGPQTDVGLWGTFDRDTIELGPKSTVEVSFEVTVPDRAEPGDHLGAMVVESASPGGPDGLLRVVTRVSTRLYVTVPGEATRSFRIESAKGELDSWLFPGAMRVDTVLRNTGRMRLHPKVTIGGVQAKGPDVILSASVEPYRADVDVPWWGGPVRIPVVANTQERLTREAMVSRFVIPWGLLICLAGVIAVSLIARTLWARRNRKVRRMQEDIRRLEELVAAKNTATTIKDLPSTPGGQGDRHRHAALKRARRTGETDAAERLAGTACATPKREAPKTDQKRPPRERRQRNS